MQVGMVAPGVVPTPQSSLLASALQEIVVKTLGRGVGWWVLVLALLGALLPMPRGTSAPPGRSPSAEPLLSPDAAAKVVLIPYALCLLGAMSLIVIQRSTYLTPILPAIVVLASFPLARLLADGPAAGTPARRVAAGVALVVVVTATAVPAIRFDMALAATDTRTQAKTWVESNLPPGSRIALEDFGPPLNPTEAQLLRALQIDSTRVGSWQAAKRGLNQMKLEVGRARRPQFAIFGVGEGQVFTMGASVEAFQLPDPMLDPAALEAELERRAIRYVILSSKAQPDRPMEGAEPPAAPRDRGFSRWLGERAVRIARFVQDRPAPTIDRGPGRSFHSPVIEVYEIRASQRRT
jgi:hypothetical protein